MTRITHGFHNDHAKLKHLLWSEAGHVFDTDADLNSHKIINLLDPTSAQDAATKAYVDIYRDMINYADSPMIVTGGELSEGTNAGTLKVAALTALLRKTDSTTGELTYVTKDEEDNISIPSTGTIYYVILNYNSGSPTITLETSIPNRTTNIPIGKVMKDASNTVHYITGGLRLQDGLRKLHERAKTLREVELQSGCAIGYTGTNNFTMTSGVVYAGINKIELPSFDSTSETFTYLYRDGSGGWTEVSANAIDPSHYDDGTGTLAEVANNRYSCHWVYRHVSDGHVYVLYGRGSYKLAEAETAGEPDKPEHLATFGCLIGKIIAPKNGGSFTEIQMVTDTFFVGTKVSDHSELSNLVWSQAGHTIDEDLDVATHKIVNVVDPTAAQDVATKNYVDLSLINWYDRDWKYRKLIVIDHTKVAGNLTDFPFYLYLNADSDLNSKAQADGADILFTDINNNKLSHEIEYYGSGTLHAWIKLPNISSSEDTYLWMYYGNSSASNQENAEDVWSNGYVMVQHMNDATTSTIQDSTSYHNDGTKKAANEPIETTGKIYKGQDFDGTDDYVDCGNDTSLDITDEITVEAWVKTELNDDQVIVSKYSTSGEKSWYLTTRSSSRLQFVVCNATETCKGDTYTFDYYSSSLFHHVVGVYDGTDVILYINGASKRATPHSGNINVSSVNVDIGSFYNTLWEFHGIIDEVRISNVARSAEWIETEYNNMNSPFTFYKVGTQHSW